MPLRVSRFLLLLAALAASWSTSARAQTQFAQPQVVKTGNWPAAVYAADMNGDGFSDLIYIDQGATSTASTTHVLLNNGKGGFSESSRLATTGVSVAIGDLTGNGHIDIGWIGATPYQAPGSPYNVTVTVSIAPGLGDGTFGALQTRTTTGYAPNLPDYRYLTAAAIRPPLPSAIVVEDVANNYLVGFLGTNSGFDAALPDGPGPITVQSLSGNGKLDLIVNGTSAQIYLNADLVPLGYPTLPSKRFTSPSAIRSLLVQEVDNDTYPDLVIEGANGRFDIYHGNGDGTFSTQSEGGSGTLDGTTGNGGHLIGETTLANGTRHNFITATPAGVSVLVGQGNLTYVLKGVYNAGPGRSAYALADFNGDGNLDLAVDSPEGVAILYGNADGSFQSSLAYAAGQPAISGALGAFTNSGNLDAVVGTPLLTAQVMLGQGDGSFVPFGGAASPKPTITTTTPASGSWGQMLTGDFDGDGRTDIGMTIDGPSQNNGSPALPYFAGSGLWVQYNPGKNNGDFGFVIVMAPYYSVSTGPNSAAYPWFGTGAVGAFGGSAAAKSIAILNGARLQVLNGANTTPPLALLQGFDDLTDGIGIAYNSDVHAHDLTVAGDLNHDGADDLIVQHNGLLTVYLSLKNGQFRKLATTVPVAAYVSSTWGGASQTYNEPAFPGSMAIADLNGDGFGDLVVAYDDMGADHTQPTASRPNHILIWLGNGDGTFKGPETVVPSRNFYQIALADLNGDGHPDLVMHDGYVLSVQYGKGDGTFGAETHYLAGMGLNTISAGDLNHDGKVDLVVANGGTFFGNPVANHEAPVANPDVNSGGVTVLLNTQAATQPAASGSIVATPNPVAWQGAFNVTIALNGSPAPTGTVTFTIDGAPAGGSTNGVYTLTNGAVTLSFPVASFSVPLTPGAHALAAVYAGDANYSGATLTGTLTVGLAPTSVVLTPTTPLLVYYGQGIDGLFAITASYPTTGTYTVLDNGVAVPICTNLPVSINGVPNDCPYGNPVLLDAGPHSFSVAYNGDSENAPSVSAAVPYVVAQDLTTASLASSLNPSTVGQTVTFTATMTGNAAVPAGSVTFFDGAAAIGAATLNAAGVATLTTGTLAVGTHPIRAVYAATTDFNAASSTVVSQVVNPQAVPPATPLTTAIQLTSSLNPAPAGFGLILTATVVSSGNFPVVPAGSVSFLDGGAIIGTGVLNNLGVATFATSTLAVGRHALTASYAGATGSGGGVPPPSPPKPPVPPRAAYANPTQTLLPSVSPVLTEVITTPLKSYPASFSLSVTPDPVYVPAGQDAVLAVHVLVEGNFTQTIQLGCTGLPAEASCVFVNNTIGSAGGTTTLYVLPQGPHGCGANGAPYYGLLGLFGLAFVRKRRRMGLLLAAVCLFGLVGLSGCGSGCTDLGVIPGNYNFVVTGTPSVGPVTGTQGWTVGMKVTLP
ncbi:Repeat domain-containing protein [Granulicella rosea]|uniref:Repeat domain-containing protein n=1 Tax=Granulicella rosea TaxID=474952 RepID=A0A239KLM2_9BACT|nr:FG-GAP-like repeat-containing protein [Granulicella rosea]SNT19287.1 Repeat domain-containing protein [Granulicella rosea]